MQILLCRLLVVGKMNSENTTLNPLLLEHQLCFRFYTVSRLITKIYQPYLEGLGLTYVQYLVLLVLWEKDGIPVGTLVEKLGLNTNTLTPLLKRMEVAGLICRTKGTDDERKVLVTLTEKSVTMRDKAIHIPENLYKEMLELIPASVDYELMRKLLDVIIGGLKVVDRRNVRKTKD